jgi:hypothetical protein
MRNVSCLSVHTTIIVYLYGVYLALTGTESAENGGCYYYWRASFLMGDHGDHGDHYTVEEACMGVLLLTKPSQSCQAILWRLQPISPHNRHGHADVIQR